MSNAVVTRGPRSQALTLLKGYVIDRGVAKQHYSANELMRFA